MFSICCRRDFLLFSYSGFEPARSPCPSRLYPSGLRNSCPLTLSGRSASPSRSHSIVLTDTPYFAANCFRVCLPSMYSEMTKNWRPQSLHLYCCFLPLRPFLTTLGDPQKKHFLTISAIIFAKILKSMPCRDFILLFVDQAKSLFRYKAHDCKRGGNKLKKAPERILCRDSCREIGFSVRRNGCLICGSGMACC